MGLARRDFLKVTGVALAAGSVTGCLDEDGPLSFASREENGPAEDNGAATPDTTGTVDVEGGDDEDAEWAEVRNAFGLTRDYIHMSAMLVASHPKPVRDAIEHHRRNLDADPVNYLESTDRRLKQAAREAAAAYLGTGPSAIALTDSTTMGLGLVYNGLRLRSDQEILTTEEDYYVTHESLRLASERTGANVRRVSLHDGAAEADPDQMVERIIEAIRPETRVLAVTWVHSSTGLKLPVSRISEALAEIDADRDEEDQVLFCVDAVHGFGVEDANFADLGCDFYIAGCHKWLFGPRGTGIVAGTDRGWRATLPMIPSFIDGAPYQAWLGGGGDPSGPTTAARMTPGGFKPFEHEWAMVDAFEWQQGIGRSRVAARTHQLASQLKQGLAELPGVTVFTPMSEELSAGIVSFDVGGLSPSNAVSQLRNRGIVASTAPYATPRVRLTPSIRNTSAEIDTVISEVGAMVSG